MKIFRETQQQRKSLFRRNLEERSAQIVLRDCRCCGKTTMQAAWVRIKSDGDRINAYRCKTCDVYMEGKHAGEAYPLHSDNRSGILCERCASPDGVQEHHWAPRYLFPDEFSQWPTGWLCRVCHQRWHRIVTPDMSAKKADE